MARVPFNTNTIKMEYLEEFAKKNLCRECDGICTPECKKSDINRNIVGDVQDFFEVRFSCFRYPHNYIRISKFFLPNSLFEEKYMQDVNKIAETKMDINGKEILDELLKWGRLEIIDD